MRAAPCAPAGRLAGCGSPSRCAGWSPCGSTRGGRARCRALGPAACGSIRSTTAARRTCCSRRRCTSREERAELAAEVARTGRELPVRVRRHRSQCRAVLAVRRRASRPARTHPRDRAGARQLRAALLQCRRQSRRADQAAHAGAWATRRELAIELNAATAAARARAGWMQHPGRCCARAVPAAADRAAAKQGIDRIDALKIDVEGMEDIGTGAVLPRRTAVAVAAPDRDRGFAHELVDRPVRALCGEAATSCRRAASRTSCCGVTAPRHCEERSDGAIQSDSPRR